VKAFGLKMDFEGFIFLKKTFFTMLLQNGIIYAYRFFQITFEAMRI
jgi:hypothetical protein